MTGRFDYVRYDDLAADTQAQAKEVAEKFERFIESHLTEGRAKSLALSKLEEAYMWIGKAIRDHQIKRTGGAELEERRGEKPLSFIDELKKL